MKASRYHRTGRGEKKDTREERWTLRRPSVTSMRCDEREGLPSPLLLRHRLERCEMMISGSGTVHEISMQQSVSSTYSPFAGVVDMLVRGDCKYLKFALRYPCQMMR